MLADTPISLEDLFFKQMIEFKSPIGEQKWRYRRQMQGKRGKKGGVRKKRDNQILYIWKGKQIPSVLGAPFFLLLTVLGDSSIFLSFIVLKESLPLGNFL